MARRNGFIVSVFLVFMLAFSGMLFAQRVIDLDKVWGDLRVLGASADDWSGHAVAHGDINGDGYMDIIIGAWGAGPAGRLQVGETYVFFGKSFVSPSTIDLSTESADITVIGDDDYDYCGYAVACGNVNGDGYDDIIIGAHNADPGSREAAGETYVIFGKSFASPSTIDLNTESADITVIGDDPQDHCGYAVACGDINGNGYNDVIISAPYADPGATPLTDAGKTYVIFGNSFSSPPYIIDLDSQLADIVVCGADAYDESGCVIASGNINGDSFDDIIIGAHYADPGTPSRSNAGETYVIFGSGSPSSTIDLSTESADITVYGDDAEDYCGSAVSSGDANGDSFDDIIIGAPWADPIAGANAGETYVIFSNSYSSPPYTIDLHSQLADITVCGAVDEDLSGHVVASGNVNGDGYYDIIIGAIGAVTPGGADAGETYVIIGSSFSSPPYTIDLNSQVAEITICGINSGDEFGVAVASGDVNGDGFDDLTIGAHHADPLGRSDAGETYLIAGGGAFITAHGLGGKSWIKQFSLLTNDWNSFKAFGAVNSQGEVHMAVGDIDADKLDEIAAGQGEGGKSWVKFFEVDGSKISGFKAFGASNTNGELHMTIGNFDADTSDNEIAIAMGEGGQSWVKVFEVDATFISSIKAFGATNAQGEVHLASGDLENADGIDEIVAAMGEGGSSRVKIFSYDGTLVRSFAAFDSTDNPGGEVRLAVGNFDADADLEIAASTGYNGGNLVRLFGKDGTSIGEFTAFGFGANTNGDVQIAAADIDNDGIDEVICAHGEGGSSAVKVFKPDGSLMLSFKAFGSVNAQGEVHLGRSNY